MTSGLLAGVRQIPVQGLLLPLALMTVLVLMVIPVPPLALDVLFTFNIALSLTVLLVTVYAPRPLDFAVFPSLLLIATLLRLSLNVASTRIVLMEGHEGPDAAGQVILAFGNFVAGGNHTVGFVVFTILVIINFVVVTKGAGRVSEVSARFTLDAMPGKQMAIDSDLNAGIVDQDQARERRQEIAREADFYGAMDGASKFVRGDAVAGIFILLVNIVGGLIIGPTQHELHFLAALQRYGLLTIGDGLAAQLPSLLLSTATAILVTRVSHSESMSEQFTSQVFGSPHALAVAAAILALLGLIPGMPNGTFLLLAAALAAASWASRRKAMRTEALEKAAEPVEAPPRDLAWQDIERPDVLGVEVGYRIIPLLRDGHGGILLSRIKGIRKKLSQELGFLIPPVHIRDNLELPSNSYRITLHGVPLNQGEVLVDRHLAINPGTQVAPVDGIETREPSFGLSATWIDGSRVQQAQTLGYTVVDAATVVATHLSRVILDHAADLLGHDEAQNLLDRLAESSPRLAEDLVPNTLPLHVVVKVLKSLLRERVSIRDMRSIAESLTEHAARSQDPVALTEAVREGLGRAIVQDITGLDAELSLITLQPGLERILLDSIGQSSPGEALIEPDLARKLQELVRSAAESQEGRGAPAALAVAPELRNWLSRLLRPVIPSLHVLAFTEIPEHKTIRIAMNIGSELG